MQRGALVIVLCLTACARGYGRGELSPTETDALRDVLQAYVIAQESHFAEHTAYTASLADLGVSTEGATLTVLSATDGGHAAVVRHGDHDAGCAVFVGDAAAPSTPGGRETTSEGVVVCDVD